MRGKIVCMINKNKKILGWFFASPIIIFGGLFYFCNLEWEILLLLSVITFLLLLILFKAIIYYRQLYRIVNWLLFIGSVVGIGCFLYYEKTIYLSYIIMFLVYLLFANLFIEKSLQGHFEYHIKQKLNSKFKDIKYDDTLVFEKKYYLCNLRIINFFISTLGIVGGILLVLTIVKGLQLLDVNGQYGDGLGLLGVGLGILGFLGILISMENNRDKSKYIIENFYFILENKDKKKYKDKLINIDTKIIGSRDIPYLFDLVIREDQKQSMIEDLQEIFKSNTNTTEVVQKEESFLKKVFKLFI